MAKMGRKTKNIRLVILSIKRDNTKAKQWFRSHNDSLVIKLIYEDFANEIGLLNQTSEERSAFAFTNPLDTL